MQQPSSNAASALSSGLGQSSARLEHAALIRGKGCYIDDVKLAGLLHAVFLRSPVAHGRIVRVDPSAALAIPGVHAVFFHQDLRTVTQVDRIPMAMPSKALRFDVDPYVLSHGEVHHVGEPIAIIVADNRHLAEDAAAQIELEIDPLPVVVDPRLGLQEGAPCARSDCPDNLVAHMVTGYGDTDAAFAQAAHVVSERFHLHKGCGNSLEPRGVVARWDDTSRHLTVWDSTQMPHRAKRILCTTLGLSEDQVRVIAPDVGGGFGPKFVFHPEELAVAATAMLMNQPVKWIEDRFENFTATTQERDQYWEVEAATDADGRLLGIRGSLIHDHGAYTPYGLMLPYNAATNLVGPYVLPAYKLELSLCLTNLVPATPTRGAGRPQGMFVMERLLDRLALTIGLGRDEIRRRNFIQPSQLPYRTGMFTRDGGEMTYDSGDYVEAQRRALALMDWDGFETRRQAAAKQGRYLGLGLANYIEGTGRGPFESAVVSIGASGQIVVSSGACSQGQGTISLLAQLAAAQLGVQPEQIRVRAGDTDAVPNGLGAFASRQAVTAGNAVHQAARQVREKILRVAAAWLQAQPEDLTLQDGKVYLSADTERSCTVANIAEALAGSPGYSLPAGMEPGLQAAVDFQPVGLSYSNGTHMAEVEVDPETGVVNILRYLIVHDCGTIVHPKMLEGQIVGGTVHGISSALYEWMRYGQDGQPLTCTYIDYLLSSAEVSPRIEVHHMSSPTPFNPLGIKGAGEGGTIGAIPAMASAVEDALRPYRVAIREIPMTPVRLSALVRAASSEAMPV